MKHNVINLFFFNNLLGSRLIIQFQCIVTKRQLLSSDKHKIQRHIFPNAAIRYHAEDLFQFRFFFPLWHAHVICGVLDKNIYFDDFLYALFYLNVIGYPGAEILFSFLGNNVLTYAYGFHMRTSAEWNWSGFPNEILAIYVLEMGAINIK